MSKTPGGILLWFLTIIRVWRSQRPLKKFLGLSVDEFEAELKPCTTVREEIDDLDAKLTEARSRRDKLDVEGLDLANRLVNAIKSDETEGEDSALLEGFGYITPSNRKSGFHRNTPQPTADATQKAA
jgi:cell division septum initiation protein DivIVA